MTGITYDADGQRVAMTDGTGTSTWTYDSLRRLRSSTDGTSAGGGGTVSYSYDLRGKLTAMTYPRGLVVTRTYDDAGRLVSVEDSQTGKTTTYTPDADGNVTSIQYPNATAAAMSFDKVGALTSITDTFSGNAGSITYGRDANNQVASSTSSGTLSDTHSYGYTPLNQLATKDGASYQYDLADNLTTVPALAPGATPTVQSFDPANEIRSAVAVIAQVGSPGTATGTGSTLAVTYPTAAAGDEIVVGVATQDQQFPSSTPSGFTPIGGATTGATRVTVYGRRSTGNESSVTFAFASALDSHSAVAAVYRGVDPSQPVETSLGAGGTATQPTVTMPAVTAAAAGDQLIAFTGTNGNATPGSWSAPTGMAMEGQVSGQPLTSAALMDQPLGAAGSTGSRTATFTATASTPLAGLLFALRPATSTYTFDSRGNRTGSTSLQGVATSISYDQTNRITDNAGASYRYNGDGLRMQRTTSAGTQHFTWDVADSLPLVLDDGISTYVYGPGGIPLEQISDAAPPPITRGATSTAQDVGTSNSLTVPLPASSTGDVIMIAVNENAVQTVTSSDFTAVATAQTTGTSPTQTILFLSRPSVIGHASTAFTFTGGNLPAAKTAVAAVYHGVDVNNPLSVVDQPSVAALSGTGTTLSVPSVSATYPGSMLIMAQGAAGHLTASSWSGPSGGLIESIQANGQALSAAGVADQLLSNSGPTSARTATFGTAASLSGILVTLRPQRTVLYFNQDQLGSTRVLSDELGGVRATFAFDPYGNLTSASGAVSTPLLYNGQYRDAESGNYYLRARYYEPATGQFLSRDPLVATTRSAYGYVGGNPLNGSDPSGLDDSLTRIEAHVRYLVHKIQEMLHDYELETGKLQAEAQSGNTDAQAELYNHGADVAKRQDTLRKDLQKIESGEVEVDLPDALNGEIADVMAFDPLDVMPPSITKPPTEPGPGPEPGGGVGGGGGGDTGGGGGGGWGALPEGHGDRSMEVDLLFGAGCGAWT